jgi:peroxiredoxin
MSHPSRTIVAPTVFLVAAAVAASLRGAEPPQVGAVAPDFKLSTTDGAPVQLAKLTADGPVVLVVLRGFPGYQCPACNAQTGQLIAAADKFRAKNARIVLVYPGQSAGLGARAGEFLDGKTLPDNVRLVLDPDYTFTELYGLRWDAPRETAYPSTFVIDAGGIVRFAKISRTHGGRTTTDEILKALDEVK